MLPTTNQLLERMWFSPITAEDPLYRVQTPHQSTWLTVEAVVPMEKLMTLDLKRDGFAPLYLQEVDEGMKSAIVSTVMEC